MRKPLRSYHAGLQSTLATSLLVLLIGHLQLGEILADESGENQPSNRTEPARRVDDRLKRGEKKRSPSRSGQNRLGRKTAKIGQKLPDLQLYDLSSKKKSFEQVRDGKPALLVTASLTCPVARRTYADLEKLAEPFKDRLVVCLLYTIEAHPQTDPSPYRGKEWITPKNQRDGILCRQPKTLKDRLVLARRFKKLLNVSVDILVDGMEDRGWEAVGSAPNMALLVSPDGVILARQPWFRAADLRPQIETALSATSDRKKKADRKSPTE